MLSWIVLILIVIGLAYRARSKLQRKQQEAEVIAPIAVRQEAPMDRVGLVNLEHQFYNDRLAVNTLDNVPANGWNFF